MSFLLHKEDWKKFKSSDKTIALNNLIVTM